jgi:hypothetical protein
MGTFLFRSVYFRIQRMATTLPEELEKEILERLENGEDKNDIILDVAERQGLDWKQVEALVDSTQVEHADDITLAQSPILTLLALGLFTGGLALAGYDAYNLMTAYDMFKVISGEANQAGAVGGFLVYLIGNGGGIFWLAIFAAGMIIGSLKGMEEVWTAIFAKLGIFQGTE